MSHIQLKCTYPDFVQLIQAILLEGYAVKTFTKFTSKSDKGTGLGLFISKNIIEAHGGKIWAENNKYSKGATFAFNLPLIK